MRDPELADDVIGSSFPRAVSTVLRHVRDQLDLESWWVSRRRGDEYLVLAVAGQGPARAGDTTSWPDSLCDLAARGLAPCIAPDVDDVELYRAARDVMGADFRAFVTVPLLDVGGEVLGSLCGASPNPRDASLLDAAEVLGVLGSLLGSLLGAELRAALADRRALNAERLADSDELTGLANRRGWDRALVAEDARCRRYGSAAAILVTDLDGLKAVNDICGHDAGDAVLRRAAKVLREQVRASDVAARLGGDEFGLLLTECDLATAGELGDRTRAALSRAGASASVGVAGREAGGLTAAWLGADRMMAAEKRRRRRGAGRPDSEPAADLERSAPRPVEEDELVTRLVAMARLRLGADIAFLARVEGGRRVMRELSSVRPLSIGPGAEESLESTLCARILDGRLPNIIPDTQREPSAAELAVTLALPIGSYVGVPVVLPDGRLYGTLCCLTHLPRSDLGPSDAAFLEALAGSLAHVLAAEELERSQRHRTLSELDDVAAGRGLRMLYQPLCRLVDRAEVGLEALSRFLVEPHRAPDTWFEQATRFGRGVELELLTARAGLDGAVGYDGLLSVNLSPSSICSPGLPGLLEGRDLSRLVLEISEHERVDDYGWLTDVLAPWRADGLQVAVDDAGSGFASLRHVVTLAPEIIKLDISLIHEVDRDPVRQALVRAMTSFAGDSHAQLLAEGVESEAELDVLLCSGVTLGQGWLLGRPAPFPSVPLPRVGAGQRTPSRSTTNTSVSFGPMAPPAPRAP